MHGNLTTMAALLALAGGCFGEGYVPGGWELEEKRVSLDPSVAGAASRATAVPGGSDGDAWPFHLTLPTGVNRDDAVLAAEDALELGAEASVEADGDRPATVSGLRSVRIGDRARVGIVYGGLDAPLSLGSGSRVLGYVKASSTIEQGDGASVAFGTQEGARDWGEAHRWHVKAPAAASGEPVVDAASSLSPGRYDRWVAPAGQEVHWREGQYIFNHLEIPPGTVILLEDSWAPTYVWVKDTLIAAGSVRCAKHPRLVMGYAGSAPPRLNGGFCGAFVAPEATLRLHDREHPYQGAFFARAIDVGPGVVVKHDPFSVYRRR